MSVQSSLLVRFRLSTYWQQSFSKSGWRKFTTRCWVKLRSCWKRREISADIWYVEAWISIFSMHRSSQQILPLCSGFLHHCTLMAYLTFICNKKCQVYLWIWAKIKIIWPETRIKMYQAKGWFYELEPDIRRKIKHSSKTSLWRNYSRRWKISQCLSSNNITSSIGWCFSLSNKCFYSFLWSISHFPPHHD